MRWLALALCLLVTPALAQTNIIGGGLTGDVKVAGGGAYQGPGDIVSGALFWYGLRAYNASIAAAATQKAVNVRNTGTNETCDILVATSGGLASTVANCSGASSGTSVSTFCTGGCTATKMYDQSGALSCGGTACDTSQASAGAQPTFTLSCINSKPCLSFASASTQYLQNVTITVPSTAQPYTYSSMAFQTTNVTGGIYYSGTNGIEMSFRATPGIGMRAPTDQNIAFASATWYAIQEVFNGASSVMYVNGGSTSTSPGTAALGGSWFFGTDNFSQPLNGKVSEFGAWAVGFNSTQQSNMNSNQTTYY